MGWTRGARRDQLIPTDGVRELRSEPESAVRPAAPLRPTFELAVLFCWDAALAWFCWLMSSLQSAPPSERKCRLSASMRENDFAQPAQVCDPLLAECRAWCRLQSCWRANPLPHPGHSHMNGRSSVCERK